MDYEMEHLTNMRVSVCVPTVNRIAMLKDALGSLKSQTYDNFELVLSDNSGDVSYNRDVAELVEGFGFAAVCLFHQPKKLNLVENCNFLIDHAHGDLWLYLPDDDVLQPECLERFVAEFTRVANLDLAFSDHWNMDSTANISVPDTLANSRRYGRDKIREGQIRKEDLFRLALTQAFHLQSMMFRTSFIRSLRFKEKHASFLDYVLQVSVAVHRPEPTVSYIADRLVAYRNHGGQDRYRMDTITHLQNILAFVQSIEVSNSRDVAILQKNISQLFTQIGKHQLIGGNRVDAAVSLRSARIWGIFNAKSWVLSALTYTPQAFINRVLRSG